MSYKCSYSNEHAVELKVFKSVGNLFSYLIYLKFNFRWNHLLKKKKLQKGNTTFLIMLINKNLNEEKKCVGWKNV